MAAIRVAPAAAAWPAQRVLAWVAALVLVLASALPLWVAYHQADTPLNDDSYITLTYAKNVARGRGFVFNQPPPTFGTTTPLFTLAVAGLARLAPAADLPAVAVWLSAACWLAIVWTFFLARASFGLAAWQAAVVGLLVLASGWVHLLGMEAYLFASLLVVSLALFWRGRYALSGLACGLLFLARGEGALVAALLGGAALLQAWQARRAGQPPAARLLRPAVAIALGFALPVAAWSLYATAVFGSPLPNTLGAKIAQLNADIRNTMLERLVNDWGPVWGSLFAVPGLPLLNVWWWLAGLGFIYALLRRRRWLLFYLWVAAYVTGHTLLNIAAYGWYAQPIIFVLQLSVALGLIAVIEFLLARPRLPRPLAAAAGVALVAYVAGTLALARVDFVVNDPGDARAAQYQALASWLRAYSEPAERVAFAEVGYLGYFSDNGIADLMGLVTPAAVPYVARQDYAWLFWETRPEYLVYQEPFDWALGAIRADPRFAAEYAPVATFDAPGREPLILYRRTRVPAGSSQLLYHR
jgi:hypothetical protein